jgi:hypothetical protein
MFAYPRGAAYVAHPGDTGPVWTPITDPEIDFVFYTYVDVPEADFCDIEDAVGTPNDWLPESAPACGCLEDPVLNAHRCWFGLPDLVLWREIAPIGGPSALAEWTIIPLNSGIEGVFVQEYSDHAQGPRITFDKALKPGKPETIKSDSADYGADSEVTIVYIGPRGDAEIRFRVVLDLPQQP